MRILVTGAAGSGTSTLGKLLATRLGAVFQEADDIYWLDTTPPFQQKRSKEKRREMLSKIIRGTNVLVVAGSVMSWGTDIEDAFDAIVFLTAPVRTRLERIKRRDIQQFGAVDPAFLEWAAQYDDGGMGGRSLARHNAWLAERSCPVLAIESTQEPDMLAQKVCDSLDIAR
ncbi:AAA family ATPase [Halomonas eurihalina]|uniref:AAA family ATPase n=1 Tax=Halomonas eurihalina TaxID=42566 RepID=A0A5D9DB12_HALER|nr:AAA family ATPase [Halomonas eurihalina]MDR5858603.1 AAA family ATPase [Halomonas eurihalina]TZG40789.1 AAA family ATPase [Halomonas eurihalina]